MITFSAYSEQYVPSEDEECPESEVDDFGTVVGLRDAVDFLRATGGTYSGIQCVEPSDSEWSQARWVTAYGTADYIDGTVENRSIHFPERMTAATRARVCRALTRI